MEKKKLNRLESLDVLRGFDLFCLVVLEMVLHPLAHAIDMPWFNSFMWGFSHVEWEGFSTWDLVMPLFLFMAGVSMPFSLSRYKDMPDKMAVYRRIGKRVLLLWVFGMMCQGNLLALDPDRVYLYSNTLQSIAMGYLIASLLFLHVRIRVQIGIAAALLLIFWGAMGRLLKESFEIMRSRNIPLSALIPAESWLYDYYASKGYASVFFRQELNFSSAHRFYGDGYHRVAMSMDELYRFFDEQMRRRSCCIQHGREDFNVICDDIYLDGGDVVALADSQNRLSALAFVVPGDDAVFVKELLAINTEAKEAMLHEVQSAFPGYSLRVFTEPTSENGSAVLMGMIRIVDVRRVLEAVAKNNRSLRRVFRVHDSLLPVNNGVFLVEEGECYEGVTNPCDFDIDIMELAEIVFGGSKLSSLLDFPSVRPYMSLMLD